MRYEEPPRFSRAELVEAFEKGDGKCIRDALISAFYTEDGLSVQNWCLKFVTHPNPVARTTAVTLLGNLSAVYGGKIDLLKALEAAEGLRGDTHEGVRAAAEDSIKDIVHAIGCQ